MHRAKANRASIRENAAKPGALLSESESQILQLVAAGMTNGEIAQRLHLEEEVVRDNVFSMSKKLGLTRRVELILYAVSLDGN